MKTINYTFVLICLLMINLSFGQERSLQKETKVPAPVITCADFELRNGQNYHAGWGGENAATSFDTPALDGTFYRKATAEPGNSFLYNSLYPSSLKDYIDQCLCFDYKLIDDGISGNSISINPTIIFFDGNTPQSSTIRAEFVANVTVDENSDWVHVCAPIKPSNNNTLPSSSEGQWTNVTPAQWDSLLNNLGNIAFQVDIGGARSKGATIGVDNVCLQECDIVIPDDNDGDYCCDGDNLLKNGNFEAGNVGFTSDYINNSAVFPGEYEVTNSAAAFGTTVTDHSYCADPSQYASNDQFLVVNGKTQQSGNSVVWEQTFSGLKPRANYKFCANFKNMPQCTFDILPEVNMAVSGSGSSGFNTISTNPTDPCNWINQEFNFTASSSTVTLRIILKENGNGDGNDLAIDDISLSRLMDPELDITVQHQGNPQKITASINSIDTSDDTLLGKDCEYYWYVAKVDSYPPISIDFSTFESGNNSGNSAGSSPWNLTTTFPDYNFNQNTLYIVGMYTPACGCYGEGFTYQLTLNNRPLGDEMMTEAQKQHIIDIILNGQQETILETDPNVNPVEQALNIYPNPTEGNFSLYMKEDSLKSVQIFSVTGQSVFNKVYENEKAKDQIDISSFTSGIYLVKALGADGKQYNARLIKE